MTRAVLATVAVSLAVAASAHAAPIRECGTYDSVTGTWTFGSVSGAIEVGNLTTRKVRCKRARRFSRSFYRHADFNADGTRARHRGYRCKINSAYEFADIRCTRKGGHVIRWQTGS